MPENTDTTRSRADAAPAAHSRSAGVPWKAALLCGGVLLAGGASIAVGVLGLPTIDGFGAAPAAWAPRPPPTAPAAPATALPAASAAGADAPPRPAASPAAPDAETAVDLDAQQRQDRTAALERALAAALSAAEQRLAAFESTDYADVRPVPPGGGVRIAQFQAPAAPQAAPQAAPPPPVRGIEQQPRPAPEPDPLAGIRGLLGEAERGVALEGRAAAAEPAWHGRGEVELLKATQRDLTKMVEQSLRMQLAAQKRSAGLEADMRAALEGVQERLDTLNTRVVFAAETRAAAADAAQARAAGPARPSPAQPATPAAAPAQQLPYQARAAQGLPPPRSLRGPSGRCEVVEGSADLAQVACREPGQDRPSTRVVVRGTDIPGVGRVADIRRAGRAWEVVLADGSVITQ